MAEFETKHAIDVVAHRLLAESVQTSEQDRGDFPELDDRAWQAVLQRVAMLTLALDPTDDQVAAAYEHLSSRAENTE